MLHNTQKHIVICVCVSGRTFSSVLTHTMRTSEGLWHGHSKGSWTLRGFMTLCLLLHFHYNPLFLSISSTFFLHAVLFVSLLSLFLVLSFTPSLLQSLPFCLSINISLCLSLFVSLSFLFLSFPLFLSPSLFNSLSPPFPAHFLFSYILGHVKKKFLFCDIILNIFIYFCLFLTTVSPTQLSLPAGGSSLYSEDKKRQSLLVPIHRLQLKIFFPCLERFLTECNDCKNAKTR